MKRAGLIAVFFATVTFAPVGFAQEPSKANDTLLEEASEPPAEGEQHASV